MRLEENAMKPFERLTRRVAIVAVAVATVAAVASVAPASSRADREGTPIFVSKVPDGYRDWKLISVAREEGDLDDIRAVLGNDVAVKAYRVGRLPFPDGAIIARLAWSFDASDENNNTFARLLNRPVARQSFVAGSPKNGVQFMVKDSKKYASTGGWSYGHFNDGKSADEAVLNSCHPCHAAIQARDFVFTRYAP
jgi:cytochrome P460